ncbi:MAG TPA: U32 family peptidase [Hungateiclostridium thermocellum]|jgi:putative protease|uniref:Peptidase U32 n=2 Tax=Acetivibrio thermocellus TaxID=1515 RepID=A3DE63_ACET2|nr:U32 family peptidase [Acetivibrio thermocellus]CDG35704.1 putative protease YrrO [Acetivibrio thermocellus BC1]ABN52242.1 peptidase U32 [Acetivibrio thermocellus ATCC 27405]ADU74269.1 peptidase U32 [Acetivibrio thermocellus DSM 1313]ALX08211.1 peptidase U32 [Acetivibrio thermocellus AD2]ANV75959.1 peptidase U32 [Acetivibrio thermocellus DSM 2360]
MKKVELLAPAGNLEKLKMAVLYGADAVYLGGEEFSLRAYAENFTLDELKAGVEFAHSKGKKVYVTINIFPHNDDLKKIPEYIKEVAGIGVDAIILSDPGILSIVKEIAPDMEIHLSTQANNTNFMSARFWHNHGVKRIILARELSLEEIREIREKTPDSLELEVFVHGAMCISYSGRCLLSNYMAGRDSNRGLCAHPCRWKYYLMEEKRPGEYYPVYENERGTFIFNSRDLCMIEHIPELVESGVSSFKIEGRMKSSFYVATVVKAYREAIDAYYEDKDNYKFDPRLLEEVCKVSHREFTTGFFFNKPGPKDQIYATSSYIREYDFVGVVQKYDKATKIATVEQRNRMYKGEEIEVVNPKGNFFVQKIEWMKNADGEDIDVAPHPQMTVYMPMKEDVEEFAMLRRKSSPNK